MSAAAEAIAGAGAAQAAGEAERIDAALAADPDGVIETIAAKAGARYRAVLDRLPPGAAVRLGSGFETVWAELATWGDVLFIVHTEAGVFEIDTALSPGAVGRGWFNIHGPAPLHGHIAFERCAAVYCVDRAFFGRRSCSVQFVDRDGGAMFKVFVRRGPDRAMDPDQLARFEALKAGA